MKISSKEDWKLLVDRYLESGLTKSKFCQQEGFSPSRFYDWAKRFGDGRIPQANLSRPPKKSKLERNTFVEVDTKGLKETEHQNARILRIKTNYGSVVEIPL